MKKKNKKITNRNVNIITILTTYTIFALIFIIVVSCVGGTSSDVHDLFDNNSHKVVDSLKTTIYKQNATNKKISSASKNKSYTLENPYVLKNPYELNPLSAIIAFTTDSDTTVEVMLNDIVIGTTERSKNHIIPIYGLYSRTYNNVQLTLEDGTTGNVIIKTEELEVSDDTIVNDNYDSNIYTFVSNGTNIKAYDYVNNIRFLINGLDGISSFMIRDNTIYALYNASKNVKGIYVAMDLLGHIKDVTTNVDGYIGSNSVSLNMLGNGISDYVITHYNDNKDVTESNRLDASDVSRQLLLAPLYEEQFEAIYVNEYLTYNITAKGYIVAVRSDGKIYSYKIDDVKTIKLDDNYEYSLYLNSDSSYYNLYTIVKNIDK